MAALGSAKPITSHDSLNDPTWSPDGRIVYSSGVDGNIWVMGSDGSNPKQLTSNAEGDFLFLPRVSPDGHYIVFPSLHSGLVQLWRMDSDGNNPKQLTDSFAGVGSDCSPDGKWVVWGSKFNSERGVWKVPMEGGNSVRLSDAEAEHPIISPDGKTIAVAYDAGGRCDLEAGMAKLFATEAALENSLEAMRIHGAYGYSKEFNIERYYRDAPLLAIGEGTNELQRMVADQRVIIQDGTNRLTGGHAVYTATNNLLELTKNPTWKSGLREGRGDLEQLKLQQNEMTVRGNAYVKMPAQDLGQSDFAAFSHTNRPAQKAQTDQFAEIFSQSYTLSQTNGYFSGGVRIVHPQNNWVCSELSFQRPQEGGRVDRMVAQRAVRFDSTDANGQKTSATGDQAVYTYSVTDGVTNEVLKLTGNPATLVGTNGFSFKSPVIDYDMIRKQVIASGPYRIGPPTNAVGSNSILFPKGSFSK
jgi:lipopolysaccharide export system protein LptA